MTTKGSLLSTSAYRGASIMLFKKSIYCMGTKCFKVAEGDCPAKCKLLSVILSPTFALDIYLMYNHHQQDLLTFGEDL